MIHSNDWFIRLHWSHCMFVVSKRMCFLAIVLCYKIVLRTQSTHTLIYGHTPWYYKMHLHFVFYLACCHLECFIKIIEYRVGFIRNDSYEPKYSFMNILPDTTKCILIKIMYICWFNRKLCCTYSTHTRYSKHSYTHLCKMHTFFFQTWLAWSWMIH